MFPNEVFSVCHPWWIILGVWGPIIWDIIFSRKPGRVSIICVFIIGIIKLLTPPSDYYLLKIRTYHIDNWNSLCHEPKLTKWGVNGWMNMNIIYYRCQNLCSFLNSQLCDRRKVYHFFLDLSVFMWMEIIQPTCDVMNPKQNYLKHAKFQHQYTI